jgi:hypothetical protein
MLVALTICGVALPADASTDDAQRSTAALAGVIADETGAPIAGAALTLTNDSGVRIEGTTGADGRFSLTDVPVGPFTLAIAAPGFAAQTLSGTVAPGEAASVGVVRLRVAVHAAAIEVTPSVTEIAEQQLREQEQQRVLGVVPNFYVSFIPDAAPLDARQKLHLSWKARSDPMQFAFVALAAGVQHWRDDYPGFGNGASGYAKRYAAAYATIWTRSMITQVLLPSLLRQDPRYFYKGTGSASSRVLYALSRSVIRKGDNGRWQPNYSGILGSLTSGAISNLYYPEEDRRGARLTLQNTALGIVGGAIGHVTQEFLYARFTSRGRGAKASTASAKP